MISRKFMIIFTLVFFYLSLVSCATRYIGKMNRYNEIALTSYSEYEAGKGTRERVEVVAEIKLAYDYAKKAISAKPEYKGAYLVFLESTFKLAYLCPDEADTYYRNAYDVARNFYMDFPLEILAAYWYVNTVYACEFSDKFVLNDAILAGQRALSGTEMDSYPLYKKQLKNILSQLEEQYSGKTSTIQEDKEE